ncbi:MAG TPA: 30S ribosomal protein S17e [Candidatus Pacearchaeota archaeon]|nr:30S ribosomal protein S17e [archaeon BMS3Abin17]HDK41981.1 30S ribosomal protein S17e [Candidatus Pacearchaeota archaeon]HDZ60349.1 30S ribosomal protein S17e [Candidatus Pacearchaeota archaeon]
MGKIKTTLVKRTAKILMNKGIEFSEAFEKNKKILGSTMPSKKIRNQIAGYLSRLKKEEKKKELQMLKGR